MKTKSEILEGLRIERPAPERRPGLRRFGIPVAVLLLVVVGGLLFQVLKPSQSPALVSASGIAEDTGADSPVQRVDGKSNPAATATVGTLAESGDPRASVDGDVLLDVSGHVTAGRIATVSAKTIGLINDVLVEEGMRIEKGQVLARLDSSLVKLDLQTAKARLDRLGSEVERVNLELEEARRIYERHRRLQHPGFSNKADLTRSRTAVELLKVGLNTMEVDYRIAEIQVARQERSIEDFTILAPFSGVVSQRNAQPGEIIAPSSAGGGHTRTGICTIVDMESLEIQVDVNESFIRLVREGQRVSAEPYAYEGWTFSGRVSRIIPAVDRAKGTVRVRIELLERDARILPNMAVKVSFLNS